MILKASRFNVAVDSCDGTGDVYLYNIASSGLLRVDADTYVELSSLFARGERGLPEDHGPSAPEGLDPASRDTLAASGFLIPHDRDEIGELSDAFLRARKTQYLSFVVGMTMACNFDCPYCFEEHRAEHMTKETAVQVRRFILDQVRSANAKSVHISWFGGEPLLAADVLVELSGGLLADSEQMGFEYQSDVITNGALLDGPMARALALAGVGKAQVTIDGPREIHDRRRPFRGGQPSYDRILGNLREAHREMDVRVRINVDQDNRPFVGQLVRELGEAGLLHGPHAVDVYLGKITSYTSQVEAPGELLELDDIVDLDAPVAAALQELGANAANDRPRSVLLGLAPGGCTATHEHSFVIGSRGQLFKCELGIHDDTQAVGSVHVGTAMPARGRPIERHVRKRLPVLGATAATAATDGTFGSAALDWGSFNPYEQEKCRSCQFVPVCKSGCPKTLMEGRPDDATCRFWDDNIGALVRDLAAR